MPNKIIKNGNVVSVRIDDAYTTNEKHLLTPFVKPDGSQNFFGSFKFLKPKDAEATLRDAVKQLGSEDTIFGGEYPRWIEDEYGIQLKVGNRVRFFDGLGSTEEIANDDVRGNIYNLELQISATKENRTYVRVSRAIKDRPFEDKFNDELFDDIVEETPF